MFKKLLLSFTCATALSTSAIAKEVTIQTARGDVTLTQSPAKIAVFDLGSVDTLDALGVKIDGVPEIKKFLPYVNQSVANAQNVGTLFEPNLEALNALKPELIVVGSRTAKKFDDVSAIAKTIDMTEKGESLIEDGMKRIENFGALFNKAEKATELNTELKTLFNETQNAVKNKGNGLIVLVSANKISAYGKGSRFSWIHTNLNVPMADPDIQVAGHGQPISFEYIQKLNPDWLFVLDRDMAIGREGKSAKETLDNELVRQTKAWKNNQVVYLSGASYVAAGGYSQLKTDLTAIKQAFSK